MLVVVSPAKKLDMSLKVEKVKTSKPIFSNDINRLVKAASQLSEESLQSLMKISPALARLNKERFNKNATNIINNLFNSFIFPPFIINLIQYEDALIAIKKNILCKYKVIEC